MWSSVIFLWQGKEEKNLKGKRNPHPQNPNPIKQMKTVYFSEFYSANWGCADVRETWALNTLLLVWSCFHIQALSRNTCSAEWFLSFQVCFTPQSSPGPDYLWPLLTDVPRAIQQLSFASVFCMTQDKWRIEQLGLSLIAIDLFARQPLSRFIFWPRAEPNCTSETCLWLRELP
jgi:hypothetical protein